ncbi:hypothetical protein HMI55_005616 [Coelomomyces lativittatus]|nr:hypothetical protein HMI56_003193 [Coelomomyces lativittatus]KAJ1513404.1 hypothetical protein HMI55_005616 [Coelomomyces lativittatus]
MVVEEEDDDDGDKAATESEKDIVEVGPSWVLPLTITKEQLSSQCPSGSKVLTWRNVKLELFAPYTRDDGLVTRITIFADQLRNIQGAIHERYKHRKDRLWKRVKQPSLGLQNEYFEHGRAHALERHVMKHGKTTELRFYQGARSDGLYLREEKEHKIIEHFEGRPDRLVYRSVTHEVGSEDQVLGIVKMSEHYARRTHEEFGGPGDEVLEVSCNQIYKRSFYIREEKIKVVYHVPFGSLFPGMREFRKPTSDQKSSLLEMTTSFETKPPKKPPKKQHLYARICDLLKAEQTCLSAVKASEREVKEILTTRHSEEKNIQLSVSLFDTIRNTFDITSEMQKESQKQAEEASKEASIDYLSPFLLHYIQEDNTLKLTKEEAMQVKENCLKALKERLIEKSSIIQKRYEEETMSYQKRQQHYSKNSETMSQAETEEYVQFCNDALFRIHVLEKRLAKHKETAPELYLALDKKLAADPRLASLISTN